MNLNAPIYPVAAPGLRLRVQPNESFYVQAVLFSGDVGEPATSNKHNLRFSFSGDEGALLFAETGYRWNAKKAFAGTCKLGGFFDSKEFSDNRGEGSHRGNYALYAILEQELWHPAAKAGQSLSGFAGIGGAPDDRNTVIFYGETGFNLRGALPGRGQDALGVAASYTQLSGKLAGARSHETVLEATYQWICGPHLSLQPDLQFIFTPGATRPRPTAVVTGIRLNVEL